MNSYDWDKQGTQAGTSYHNMNMINLSHLNVTCPSGLYLVPSDTVPAESDLRTSVTSGNTISNLAMILPPIYGIYEVVRQKFELRFAVCFVLLLGEGARSTFFLEQSVIGCYCTKFTVLHFWQGIFRLSDELRSWQR